MATLRKDGRYMARVSLGKKPNGKWEYKYFYGSTVEEAEKLADQYYNKYIIGNCKEITFQEYATEYMNQSKDDLAPKTYENYLITLRLHIYPYIGNILIADIIPANIKKQLTELKNKGLGAKGRVSAYLLMNQIFKEAVFDELIGFNPVLNVKKPKYVKPEMKVIPIEDFDTIYNAADDRMKDVLYLVWSTGLRVGEVSGLQHNDIKKDHIQVSRSVSNTTEGIIIKSTKSVYGKRKIPIPKNLYKRLRKIKNDSVFLFPNINNQVQDPTTISKQFSKICKKLGFGYHFHQLRHTHATLLANSNIPPKLIQERLGHHSVQFSLDVYAHKSDDLQKGIIDLDIISQK